MIRVDRAAKSARTNPSAKTFLDLATACAAAAKDAAIGPVTVPLALHALFMSLGNRLDDGPVPAAEVSQLASRLDVLLDTLARSGIQDSPSFARKIEQHLQDLRDIIP